MMAEEGQEADVFLQSDESRDFALLVEGTKVYVDRPYLANWSAVFRRIFYPDGAPFEQPDDGMVMKEKKLDEFLIFLHAIFPTSETLKITEWNLPSLVAYADEYDIGVLRNRCVKFMKRQLKKEGRVVGEGLIDYLRLASTYSIDKDLQTQLVPLVAQLPVEQITEAHETLSAGVLAAVYQAKALSQQTDPSTPTPPLSAFVCLDCSKVCAVSKGASSCCNYGMLVKSRDAAQVQSDWAFICYTCRKPCSLKDRNDHYKASSCCGKRVTVYPKSAGRKRSADADDAAASALKAAKFSADLLIRNR